MMRRIIMLVTAALLMALIMAMAAGLASARSCQGAIFSELGGFGDFSTQAGPGFGEGVSAGAKLTGSFQGASDIAQQSCP
jgi:hypothetical protein